MTTVPSSYFHRNARTNEPASDRTTPNRRASYPLTASPLVNPSRSTDVPLRTTVTPRPDMKTSHPSRPRVGPSLPRPPPPSSFRDSPTKQLALGPTMPLVPLHEDASRLKLGGPRRSMSLRVQPEKDVQLRSNLQRPSSELGYASTPGRDSPQPSFSLNSRRESFKDRPLSEVLSKSPSQAINAASNRNTFAFHNAHTPHTPSRIPSLLSVVRRRSTGSPSPVRPTNDFEQPIPAVIRSATFGIPEDEDNPIYTGRVSPKLGRPNRTSSLASSPVTSEGMLPQAPGIASTMMYHQQSYQMLCADSVGPRPQIETPPAFERHTPPALETLADTVNAYASLLRQHSVYFDELSRNCLQLANDSQTLEKKLRANLSSFGVEDRAVRAGPDQLRRVSFLNHCNPGGFHLQSQSETTEEYVRLAGRAFETTQQYPGEAPRHFTNAERPVVALGDDVTGEIRPRGSSLARLNSKRSSSVSTRSASIASPLIQTPSTEAPVFYRPESRNTFRQSQTYLSSPLEDCESPPSTSSSSHPPDVHFSSNGFVASPKGSEESSSAEWVFASVASPLTSEDHLPSQASHSVSNDSVHAELQDRAASAIAGPDVQDRRTTPLAPVWEVDSLRNRSSTSPHPCGAIDFSCPSQYDLIAPEFDVPLPSISNALQTAVLPSLEYTQTRDSDITTGVYSYHGEHRPSLVIGTKSEHPTVPDSISNPIEGSRPAVLLRSLSRKGRGLFRKKL